MKSGLDRTLLQTKDITDQPDSKWILYLSEGVLIACDTFDLEDGVLTVFKDDKAVHVLPKDSMWRLIRRHLVDLVKAEVLAKDSARSMTKLMDKLGNLPPDDQRDWS
jgi:hypothetical protein